MNVFDNLYQDAAVTISAASLALHNLIEQARSILGIERPMNVLTCSRVVKDQGPVLSIDLVHVDSLITQQRPSLCAQVRHPEEIVHALQALARHGCRGNELAFVCLKPPDNSALRWFLADIVTMTPVPVDGRLICSTEFHW
jgi:hypothetical protein